MSYLNGLHSDPAESDPAERDDGDHFTPEAVEAGLALAERIHADHPNLPTVTEGSA